MRVLILAAHPDDEVLGCGGTMARHAGEGDEVHVAILGEGITSRYSEREEADPALVEALRARSREAATLLGASLLGASLLGAGGLVLTALPDNRFDTVPLLSIVKIIEALVDRLRPRIVYTQHGGDLNIDHQLLYRATLTATRPVPGSGVEEVYAYEVASSTEWAFQKFEPVFRPNVFVDIADTLDKKIAAMQRYESEARLFPHPRSPEALRSAARRWGSVAGVEAAEAFELVRAVRKENKGK